MVSHSLFAYLGPETMLPLASFFAAIIGGLLMGWRYVISMISRCIGLVTGKKKDDAAITTPASSADPQD